MEERKKECKFKFNVGGKQIELKAYQSPRGIRHEDKRPDFVIIDCYQEFNQTDLFRHIDYLQTIACCMGNK